MKNTILKCIAITINPKIYEVLWVLLSATGINIITGAIDSNEDAIKFHINLGIPLILSGVAVFMISLHATEIYARAQKLYLESKSGFLQDHIMSVMIGYGYKRRVLAIFFCMIASVLSIASSILIWATK